jgi:hypothetical protein
VIELEVEARQGFRRDDEPRAVVQRLELGEERRGQLAVAVEDDPDFRRRPLALAEELVARGARDAQVALLDQRPPNQG